jgi:hypothetical protein
MDGEEQLESSLYFLGSKTLEEEEEEEEEEEKRSRIRRRKRKRQKKKTKKTAMMIMYSISTQKITSNYLSANPRIMGDG